MSIGVISLRYAKALLDYVELEGCGEEVIDQVLCLKKTLVKVEELGRVICDPGAVSNSRKLSLLEGVLDGKINASLRKFLKMVLSKGRASCIVFILQDFADLYFHRRKIIFAKLVSAASSPALEEALKKIVKENTGFDLRIDSEINADIIGGFIFTVKDFRIDASVARQLETLREQFIKKNRRIV